MWHFLVTPLLAAMLGLSAFGLLWTPHWPWPILTLGAFAASALAFLFLSSTQKVTVSLFCWLSLAAARLVALTWVSLALLPGLAPFSSGDPT